MIVISLKKDAYSSVKRTFYNNFLEYALLNDHLKKKKLLKWQYVFHWVDTCKQQSYSVYLPKCTHPLINVEVTNHVLNKKFKEMRCHIFPLVCFNFVIFRSNDGVCYIV